MLKDALLVLKAQGLVAVTTNESSIDLGTGTALRGLTAQAIITAIEVATGDETYDFIIQESDDDSTWADLAHIPHPGTVATAGVTGDFFATFVTNKRYIRLRTVVVGTVATGVNVGIWLGISKPT
jgi:hypothetical protein